MRMFFPDLMNDKGKLGVPGGERPCWDLGRGEGRPRLGFGTMNSVAPWTLRGLRWWLGTECEA